MDGYLIISIEMRGLRTRELHAEGQYAIAEAVLKRDSIPGEEE